MKEVSIFKDLQTAIFLHPTLTTTLSDKTGLQVVLVTSDIFVSILNCFY
jgi:hypothetical protein